MIDMLRSSWKGHILEEVDEGFGPCLKCLKCGIFSEGIPPSFCVVTAKEARRARVLERMRAEGP